MSRVVALFVDPKGPYPELLGPDNCWDESRDARNYRGSAPVVAHPPCQLWVNFAALNFQRYGGEHNRPGNDGGCFAFAIETVRRVGGVVEHPADSRAWATHGLIAPVGIGWNRVINGYVCEVWQSAYGHKAQKRTWLYYVGDVAPAELDWSRNPGTHQVGWFDRLKPTLSKRESSWTPLAFAEALIDLAGLARTGRAV